MPKILINEVDKTSAGTPGRYGNYSVLITGYQKEFSATEITNAKAELTNYEEIVKKINEGDESQELPELSATAKTVQARNDKVITDGVYEFNSVADFLEITGYSELEITDSDVVNRKDAQGNIVESHYGNRMAYELLKLGYQVIYKVISKVSDMVNYTDCWEVFQDKATYDFRFISHGLLESCYNAEDYNKLCDKQTAIMEDAELLKEIEKAVGIAEGKTAFSLTEILACDAEFARRVVEAGGANKFGNFANTSIYEVAYNYYHQAAGFSIAADKEPEEYTEEELAGVQQKKADAGINDELTRVIKEIAEADDCNFTLTVYNLINENIARLASYKESDSEDARGRGDCIALIELDENEYTKAGVKPEVAIIDAIKKLSLGNRGAYCALTVPSVYYADGTKMPAAFHYLACFMNSLGSGFAEWYAAAGYNRGVSSAVIDHTSVKLGEIAINALEPRFIKNQKTQPPFACNVIANFRGSYYLWGNRTAAQLKSFAGGGDLTAEHFLNIRQLCTTIKKQLYVACRRFTFDPNSDTLWFNFVNAITPTLDLMKADQGIRDYKVVKVFTDKKATLKAKIRIIPIEAVEDFDITVSLEDSFGGVSVTAE